MSVQMSCKILTIFLWYLLKIWCLAEFEKKADIKMSGHFDYKTPNYYSQTCLDWFVFFSFHPNDYFSFNPNRSLEKKGRVTDKGHILDIYISQLGEGGSEIKSGGWGTSENVIPIIKMCWKRALKHPLDTDFSQQNVCTCVCIRWWDFANDVFC